MMTGQSVWRSAIRNLFGTSQGRRQRRPRRWREISNRSGFAQSAEVCEERALLSGPAYGTGFSAQFANFGAAQGLCGVNGSTNSGMVTDSSGNLYINGAFSGTGNVNPFGTPYTLTSALSNDLPFVAKYGTNLNLQWVMNPSQYSTTTASTMQLFSNIAMDPVAGNIYVTGSLQGTMTLPTASGTWTVTAVNQTGFVMGLDRNTGNLVWFAEYSPQVNSVAADGSGNLYIHSTITSAAAVPWTYLYGPGTGGNPIAVRPTASGDSEPAFIKCDSNGNILWSGNFSTQTTAFGDSSVTMTVDGTGNVYFGGRIRGTVDVDPGPGIKTLTSVFQSDAVIGKIDTNGNLVWVVHNTLTDNGCSDIVVDSNGNLDASFSYPYALSVTVTVTGKGSHKTTTTTVVGGNLVQFDNNGNLNWYQTNTNNVTAILLDPAGNFYLGMGPNQASELSKYNSAGNLIWSVPNYGYGIQNMVIDPAGDIWTCGAGNGQVDVSPTSSPVYLTWPNNQTWALMLVKWTQPGGLAAALPNGAGLGAFATVEGIGSGGNGDMKLKGHR